MSDVAKIEEQIARLKKRKQRLLQRQKADQRKRDTRAKIILGGAAIALMKQQPDKRGQLTQILKGSMTDKDRLYYEQWEQDQKNKLDG